MYIKCIRAHYYNTHQSVNDTATVAVYTVTASAAIVPLRRPWESEEEIAIRCRQLVDIGRVYSRAVRTGCA